MVWLLAIVVGLWLVLALVSVWLLAQGLAPEGSRRARWAKPFAASAGWAKGAALAVGGLWLGSKLHTKGDGEERREAIDRLDAEADGLRDDVAEILDDGKERERDIIEDLLADVNEDMAEADAEASVLREQPTEMTPAEAAADAEAWLAEVRER